MKIKLLKKIRKDVFAYEQNGLYYIRRKGYTHDYTIYEKKIKRSLRIERLSYAKREFVKSWIFTYKRDRTMKINKLDL